jgi:hypothetical protein
LVAAARADDGQPAVVPFGAVTVAGPAKKSTTAVDIAVTATNTVALRGTMVPLAPFPPRVERSHQPYLRIAPSGLVDTGYPCRPNSDTMAITGPPAGMVSVGGTRFVVGELQEIVGRVENGGGTLAILPDALCGHRLAGNAGDRAAVHAALERTGANPLVVNAFRQRPRQMT